MSEEAIQVQALTSIVGLISGLATAQIQLVLLLHDKGVLKKDDVAAQMEDLAGHFEHDQQDPAAATILRTIATGLREVGSE